MAIRLRPRNFPFYERQSENDASLWDTVDWKQRVDTYTSYHHTFDIYVRLRCVTHLLLRAYFLYRHHRRGRCRRRKTRNIVYYMAYLVRLVWPSSPLPGLWMRTFSRTKSGGGFKDSISLDDGWHGENECALWVLCLRSNCDGFFRWVCCCVVTTTPMRSIVVRDLFILC